MEADSGFATFAPSLFVPSFGMSETNKLQKRSTQLIKENTQYVLAFSVIAGMLIFTGLPVFVIFFFGVLAYFIWRTLAAPSTSGTREIFEFYLIANEILRDDERRWYGFEIQDAIARGESILRNMSGAPPLVSFALGALYHKAGDHQSAIKALTYIVEDDRSDESRYIYPSPELQNYVRTLRKIEREPAEAPLMSTAVRALERARRNRGKALLESSREALDRESIVASAAGSSPKHLGSNAETGSFIDDSTPTLREEFDNREHEAPKNGRKPRRKEASGDPQPKNRQTISEVLRDIYDSKS
ncbi:MAG: hypothetical protein IPN69_09615 [Acidobacteria bacterium]|nr:hypothetical protein [Acidobacteriota bacterium]